MFVQLFDKTGHLMHLNLANVLYMREEEHDKVVVVFGHVNALEFDGADAAKLLAAMGTYNLRR